MKLVGKSKKRKKTKRIVITIVILILVLILGSAASFIALSYHVDSLDTVFPNVWAEGIELSGLTREQAEQALIESGYESSAHGISITLQFPDESSFTVTGDEVGLALNASEAANAAFNYGRDGSLLQNGMTYLRALNETIELNELSQPDYNDEIIRELAEKYTTLFNETLYDYSMVESSTQITIVKGTGLYPASSNDVFNTAVNAMRRAIDQNAHLTVRYLPEIKDDAIDLYEIHERIHVEPVSSVYDPVTEAGTVSSSGQTFDLETALGELSAAQFGDSIVIPIVIVQPAISQDEVEGLLFRDLLAERSVTNRSSYYNRNINMAVAANNINGTVLQPGETFSYNAVVGRRSIENGFRMARAIVSGRFEEAIGGGVCQVSSTIYAALLQTDFEIVSRRPHSMTVGYMPGGQDATVAYGNIDFRFKNNSDFPIRIDSSANGNTVDVKIYGTRVSDVYYEVFSNHISTTPVRLVEREDDEVPAGERVIYTPGQTGQVWETWKLHVTADGDPILDEEGKQIRTFVTRDTYRMQERLILIGPPLPDPTPTPPPPSPTPLPEDPTPTPTPTPPVDEGSSGVDPEI